MSFPDSPRPRRASPAASAANPRASHARPRRPKSYPDRRPPVKPARTNQPIPASTQLEYAATPPRDRWPEWTDRDRWTPTHQANPHSGWPAWADVPVEHLNLDAFSSDCGEGAGHAQA